MAAATIPGGLERRINDELGGVEKFKQDFIQAGVTQFGSGWAWLAVKDGKLAIMKTPNGENPLVHGAKPILGVDVWEHSYYIDYRNRRPDYLKAFIENLVNWEHVERMVSEASRRQASCGRGRNGPVLTSSGIAVWSCLGLKNSAFDSVRTQAVRLH